VSGLPGFWELLGFTIERADESEAVLRMDVPETLLSPFGTVHGGVIATLFDTGLAVAIARRLDPEDRIATHNLNVTYVAFTRDRVLRCRARVVSLRRTVAVSEGEVLAGDGTLVAKALGTFGIRRTRVS
jgi:acyl-CoA thioesterase